MARAMKCMVDEVGQDVGLGERRPRACRRLAGGSARLVPSSRPVSSKVSRIAASASARALAALGRCDVQHQLLLGARIERARDRHLAVDRIDAAAGKHELAGHEDVTRRGACPSAPSAPGRCGRAGSASRHPSACTLGWPGSASVREALQQLGGRSVSVHRRRLPRNVLLARRRGAVAILLAAAARTAGAARRSRRGLRTEARSGARRRPARPRPASR